MWLRVAFKPSVIFSLGLSEDIFQIGTCKLRIFSSQKSRVPQIALWVRFIAEPIGNVGEEFVRMVRHWSVEMLVEKGQVVEPVVERN